MRATRENREYVAWRLADPPTRGQCCDDNLACYEMGHYEPEAPCFKRMKRLAPDDPFSPFGEKYRTTHWCRSHLWTNDGGDYDVPVIDLRDHFCLIIPEWDRRLFILYPKDVQERIVAWMIVAKRYDLPRDVALAVCTFIPEKEFIPANPLRW